MIVTRFAPSPTGLFHGGNYRTAVFAYLYARKNKGKFILRIEDTDRVRSKKEYEDNIIEALQWLGLEFDETFRQSEHVLRHEELLRKLVAEGKAYVSKEVQEKPEDRAEVIRFKNPNAKISFDDAILGTITVDTTDLGDFVIAKSFSEPVFHFAVAVDDWDEGVTHVMRGNDHIPNTPRQILILQALGAPQPQYVHFPIVLGPDKAKLSKRRGAKPILSYRDIGFLPEAILNYLALVGWNPGTEQEIFTKSELIGQFDLSRVQKSGGVFDEVKLKWVNREHMLKLSEDSFAEYAKKFLSDETQKGFDQKNIWPAMIAVMRERASTFGEIGDADRAGEYRFFYEAPTPPPGLFGWKGEPGEASKPRLERVLGLLEALQGEWNAATVKEALWAFAESEGRGQVLWPTRIALSGREKSPDPFTIAGIIGRDETLLRIRGAITALS